MSGKGALGLMQLMPNTLKQLEKLGYTVEDPLDPEQNIEGGVRYLKYLLERFDGNLVRVLSAYNWGPTAERRRGAGAPRPAETRKYINKVLKLYQGTSTEPSLISSSLGLQPPP